MIRRLGVATRTGGAARKHQKLLTALALHPEGTTPKTLARETGLNVNTVKTILPKLPEVRKLMRGFYKVAEGGDGTQLPELFDWNFHNLILTCSDFALPNNRSWVWGLVKFDVRCSKDKATCRLSCDFPLNVSSICFVAGFFAYVVGALRFEDVSVSTVEFNRDYQNLRLDGARCLTVDSLVEQFKVYQKRRGLRVERKTLVPFRVDDLVDLLSRAPLPPRDDGVDRALERLTVATDANRKLMFKIIDGLA